MDYKSAGVDIETGDAFIDVIKPLAKATYRKGVMGSLGGFGALFDPKATGMIDPIFVSTTDGVGTKLRVAIEMGIHHTIGIDLVAMCVNDLIVQGAEPLYFLDYFATGRLTISQAKEVITGIAAGCRVAGCALVGGETAEMPDMYQDGDYDLAGFAVGAVERSKILPANVVSGDVILGLGSSGVHSNGFSLVRKIMKDNDLSWDDRAPWSDLTFGAEFLTPTNIYVDSVLALHKEGLLKAAAHITGGGLIGNLSRVIPEHLSISLLPYDLPPIFEWLAKTGNVSKKEMQKVFNCGIGMALVVSDETAAIEVLKDFNETILSIGYLR